MRVTRRGLTSRGHRRSLPIPLTHSSARKVGVVMTEREPLRAFPFPCFVQQPESLLERTLCAGGTTP